MFRYHPRTPGLRERLGVKRVVEGMRVMVKRYVYDNPAMQESRFVVGRLKKRYNGRWSVVCLIQKSHSDLVHWQEVRLISEEEFEKYQLLGSV